MRIDRIELYHVAMPLISPWRTAYGEDATIHSILCRMTSGSISGVTYIPAYTGFSVTNPAAGEWRVTVRCASPERSSSAT